jgi:hypothetical protein
MRVMVSLNLADIMTATRPTIQQEADPTDPGQESQLTTNSEPLIDADFCSRDRDDLISDLNGRAWE